MLYKKFKSDDTNNFTDEEGRNRPSNFDDQATFRSRGQEEKKIEEDQGFSSVYCTDVLIRN